MYFDTIDFIDISFVYAYLVSTLYIYVLNTFIFVCIRYIWFQNLYYSFVTVLIVVITIFYREQARFYFIFFLQRMSSSPLHTLEQMRKLAGSDRNKFYALSIYYSLTSGDQWSFDNSVKTSNKSVFKSTLEIPMEPFFTTLPSPFFKPSSLQVISYYRVYKLSGLVSFSFLFFFFYPSLKHLLRLSLS